MGGLLKCPLPKGRMASKLKPDGLKRWVLLVSPGGRVCISLPKDIDQGVSELLWSGKKSSRQTSSDYNMAWMCCCLVTCICIVRM